MECSNWYLDQFPKFCAIRPYGVRVETLDIMYLYDKVDTGISYALVSSLTGTVPNMSYQQSPPECYVYFCEKWPLKIWLNERKQKVTCIFISVASLCTFIKSLTSFELEIDGMKKINLMAWEKLIQFNTRGVLEWLIDLANYLWRALAISDFFFFLEQNSACLAFS